MKTIKLRVKYDETEVIKHDSRIYSSMVRFALNRFIDGMTQSEVYRKVTEKFECTKIHSHLRNSSVFEAKAIFERFKEKDRTKGIHFGQFVRYNKGLISKEEYKESRDRGFYNIGGCGLAKGNSLFELDLTKNCLVYKRSRSQRINLYFYQFISPKYQRLLQSIDICMKNSLTPVTIRVKQNNVFLTFDEKVVDKEKQFSNLIQTRVLGLDLNPNFIGLSILDFDQNNNFRVIKKVLFDLDKLNREASTNKAKFEIQQIDKEIIQLCKHYRVSKLVVEELNFKKSNKFWNKDLNRLCRNKFRYSQIRNHLSTLCGSYGVEFIEVNAAYSSLVGNFRYGDSSTPDPVAASIEIARRGYKKFSKEWFYPSLPDETRLKKVLGNQWKEDLGSYKGWKTFYNQIKKLKLRYRFPLEDTSVVLSTFDSRKLFKVLTL